jgi:hypothetical protein
METILETKIGSIKIVTYIKIMGDIKKKWYTEISNDKFIDKFYMWESIDAREESYAKEYAHIIHIFAIELLKKKVPIEKATHIAYSLADEIKYIADREGLMSNNIKLKIKEYQEKGLKYASY